MNTGVKASLFVLLATAWTASVRAQSPAGCSSLADFRETVQAEYAFSESAKRSVRDAFLEYLAPDSLVLEPTPTSGRAFYEAAKPSSAKLEWYPSAGAATGGLGFTTGPWVYTGDGEKHAYGHFVSVWRRQADCRWRVVFDGGISHDEQAQADPKLLSPTGPSPGNEPPPQKLVAQGAIDQAILEFQREAQQEGLAAGFRTYARDGDFRFYIDGAAPMEAGSATRSLKGRFIGSWIVKAQGRSSNSALAYVVGEFTEARKDARHSFLQIWQYDPKVANWGLRIFLQNP